jgi:transcription factor CON7
MIVLQQPTPNDISSFNYSRNLDLSNTSLGNFSQIPSQSIPSSMYQTAATSQYTQPSFVYGNPSITYNNHSRTSSASNLPRQTPTDASFGFEANSYSQFNYNNRYDQSSNTGNMNPQPDSKSSSLQQSASNTNISPDSPNVLPPLSEVFPTSSSTAPSPTQTQVQQVQAQQQVANAAAAAAAQNGFFQPAMYSDVNAAAAASYAAAAEGANYGSAQNSLMSQAQQQSLGQLNQQTQLASNINVDPRTLPGIQTAAMLDPTRRNSSNALLAINTGLTMGATDQSPLSAGSSAASPIVYQHPAAAHQALLNSHFMAAAQSMNNGAMMSQRSINGRKYRPDDDLASAGERPQKVYSFVALPGINTKKRPRRRYDEIERHYACNYPGCTKSYGTLNHLNAHVQMQKHGQKRHPSGKFIFFILFMYVNDNYWILL